MAYRLPYLIKFDYIQDASGAWVVNKKYLYIYVPFSVSDYDLKVDVNTAEGAGFPQLPKNIVDLTEYEKANGVKPHPYRSRLTNVIYSHPNVITYQPSEYVQGDIFEFEFPKQWKAPSKYWIRFRLWGDYFTYNDNIGNDWIYLTLSDGENSTQTKFYYSNSSGSSILDQNVGYWLSGVWWNVLNYRGDNSYHYFALDVVFQIDLDAKTIKPYFNGWSPYEWTIPDDKVDILANLKKIQLDYRRKTTLFGFEIGVGDFLKDYVRNQNPFRLETPAPLQLSVVPDAENSDLFHLTITNDGSVEVLPPIPTEEKFLSPNSYKGGNSATAGVFLKLDITDTPLADKITDENQLLDITVDFQTDDSTPTYISTYIGSITSIGEIITEVDNWELQHQGLEGSNSHFVDLETNNYDAITPVGGRSTYPYNGQMPLDPTDAENDLKIKIPYWFNYPWSGYLLRLPKNLRIFELDNIYTVSTLAQISVDTNDLLVGNYAGGVLQWDKSIELHGTPAVGLNNIDLDIRNFIIGWFGFNPAIMNGSYFHNNLDTLNNSSSFEWWLGWGYLYKNYFSSTYTQYTKRNWEDVRHSIDCCFFCDYDYDGSTEYVSSWGITPAYPLISNPNDTQDIAILDLAQLWDNDQIDNSIVKLTKEVLTEPILFRQYTKGYIIWDLEANQGLFDATGWDKQNVEVFTYYQSMKDFAESGNSIGVGGNQNFGILYQQPIYGDQNNELKFGLFTGDYPFIDYSKVVGRYDADTNEIRLWLSPQVLKYPKEWFKEWKTTDFFGDGSETFTLVFKDLNHLSNLRLDLDEKLTTDDQNKYPIQIVNWDLVKAYKGNTEWEPLQPQAQIPNLLYVDDYSYDFVFLGVRFYDRKVSEADFKTPYLKIGDEIAISEIAGSDGSFTLNFFYEPPITRAGYRTAYPNNNGQVILALQNKADDGGINYGFYILQFGKRLRFIFRLNDTNTIYYETPDISYDENLPKPINFTVVFDNTNQTFTIYTNGRQWFTTTYDDDTQTTISTATFNEFSIWGASNQKTILDTLTCSGCYGASFFTAMVGGLRIFNRPLTQDEAFQLTRQLYLFPSFILNWKAYLKRILQMEDGQPNALKKLKVELLGKDGTYTLGTHLKMAFISESQIQSGELNIENIPYLPIIDTPAVAINSPSNPHNSDDNLNDKKLWLLITPDYKQIPEFIEIPNLRLRNFFLRKAHYFETLGGKLIYPNDWVGEFSIGSAFELMKFQNIATDLTIDDDTVRSLNRWRGNKFASGAGYVYPLLVKGNREDVDENTPLWLPVLTVGGSISYYANEHRQFQLYLENIIKKQTPADRQNKNQEWLIEYDHLITRQKTIDEIVSYKPITLEVVGWASQSNLWYGSNNFGEINTQLYLNTYDFFGLNHIHKHGWNDKLLKYELRLYVDSNDYTGNEFLEETPADSPALGYFHIQLRPNKTWNSSWFNDRYARFGYYSYRNADLYSQDNIYTAGFSNIYIGKEIPIGDIQSVGRFSPLIYGSNYTNFNLHMQNQDWKNDITTFFVPIIQLKTEDGRTFYFGMNAITKELVDITSYITETRSAGVPPSDFITFIKNNALHGTTDLSNLTNYLNDFKTKYGENSTLAFGVVLYNSNPDHGYSYLYGLEVELMLTNPDHYKHLDYVFYSPTTNQYFETVDDTNKDLIETIVITPTPSTYIYIRPNSTSQPSNFLNHLPQSLKWSILPF